MQSCGDNTHRVAYNIIISFLASNSILPNTRLQEVAEDDDERVRDNYTDTGTHTHTSGDHQSHSTRFLVALEESESFRVSTHIFSEIHRTHLTRLYSCLPAKRSRFPSLWSCSWLAREDNLGRSCIGIICSCVRPEPEMYAVAKEHRSAKLFAKTRRSMLMLWWWPFDETNVYLACSCCAQTVRIRQHNQEGRQGLVATLVRHRFDEEVIIRAHPLLPLVVTSASLS